jgi:hypothetical protein
MVCDLKAKGEWQAHRHTGGVLTIRKIVPADKSVRRIIF